MADFLSIADRAYLDLRLEDIERDPVGYTRFAEVRTAIGQLLQFGPTADEATLDRLRNNAGLPYLNPLRTAAAQAARDNAVTYSLDGDVVSFQARTSLWTLPHALEAEIAAARVRLSAAFASLAAAGYTVLTQPCVVAMDAIGDAKPVTQSGVAYAAQQVAA